MPSPPLSISVSDPNFSSEFPPKPSSNNNNNSNKRTTTTSAWLQKVSRRSSTSDFRTCDHNNNNNSDRYPCYSPYYRGLMDQSLASNNELHASQNLQSNSNNTNNLLTKYSPYYKGLTDFSLVLTTSLNDECDWRLHELEGAYACSPYYRGLTDYSLAICGFEIGGGYGPVGGPSNIGPKAHNTISALSSCTSRCSPHYRGLMEQSLAINNELHASQNLQSNSNNTNNLLTKYSPYYKGLTDFSLVLHGRRRQLTTSRLHELEGAYECSPNYRGLIDYSLWIREFEIGRRYGPGGESSNIGAKAHHAISPSSSYASACTTNLGLGLGLCFCHKKL